MQVKRIQTTAIKFQKATGHTGRQLVWALILLLPVELMGQDMAHLPTSTTGTVVRHEHYALSYSEKHEQAEWVAYELTPREAGGELERTDDFRRDPGVPNGSPALSDFRGSGYDRGHLAPAGDMSFSHTAISQSFYLSNMAPQEASFNRGGWRELEAQVRAWAIENGPLYVVTGGILENQQDEIGPNDVTVPGAFYKILLDQQPPMKALAFVMENERAQKPLKAYTVTIDRVEASTGIDFFHEMPPSKEKKLENRRQVHQWDFDVSSSPTHQQDNQQEYYTNSNNKININTASASQLDRLYGIGPAKAKAIIKARPYSSTEDLTRARGIGDVTLSRIEAYITAGLPGIHYDTQEKSSGGDMNINHASRQQLKSLPGIGEVLSARLIRARPFESIDAIDQVKGIGPKTLEKIRPKITVD